MTVAIGSIANNAFVNSSDIDLIFTSYGNEINRFDGFLPVGSAVNRPSTNAVASSLAYRGLLGEINFGYLGVQPAVASASTLMNATAPSGHTGNILQATAPAAFAGNLIAATVNGTPVFVVAASAATFSQALNANLGLFAVSQGSGFLAGLFKNAAADPAQTLLAVTNNANSVTHFSVDSGGNGVFRTQVTAPTFVGNLTGQASAIAPTLTLPFTQIADYKPGTSASAGTVSIAAGGAYTDSGGAQVGPLGAQTAAMPTQPTGTNIQYVDISLAPTTGAPVVTAGTAGVSPAKPTTPAGNQAVAMVTWRGATTLPTGIIAAADIVDKRGPGGVGGGSGGGSGASSTLAFVTNGDLHTGGTLPNSLDVSAILNSSSSLGNIAALLKAGATQAPILDTQHQYVQPDVVSRLITSGTNGVTLQAGNATPFIGATNSPWTVALYGASGLKVMTATGNLNPTNAIPGGAGTKYLFVDLNAAGPAPTILWSSTAAAGTYQQLLRSYYYDGSSLQPRYASSKALQSMFSNQLMVDPFIVTNLANDLAATISTTAYAKPANMDIQSFYLPEAATVMVFNFAQGFWNTANALGGTLEMYATFDLTGSRVDCAYMIQSEPALSSGASTQANWTQSRPDIIALAGGTHTLTQTVKGSAALSDVYTRSVKIVVFGQGTAQ